MRDQSSLTFEPLGAQFGAKVRGVDPRMLSPADAAVLREALGRYLVLCFPALHPSPDALETVLSAFGALGRHRYKQPVSPAAPHTMWLDSDEAPLADVWHSDATFSDCPPGVLGLHMVEGPAAGGDTVWNSLEAAYGSYSEPMKGLFEQLTCIHAQFRDRRVSAEHPLVVRNAVTGRPSLFTNRQWARRIPQLDRAESARILELIHSRNEQLRFGIRWRWTVGDVVVWDNRATLHCVVNDNPGRRRFHRVGVKGLPIVSIGQTLPHHPDASGTAASSVYGDSSVF